MAQLDRDKVLLAAQKLVEKKRYDKAILEYQKIIAEDPKDARTLLKIGDLYLKMEQYVEAITTYERVGQFYAQTGFALKAIAVYKQIREIILKHVPHLEDRFGHIVPRLAEIYQQLGLTSDALASYDEVATRLQKVGRDRDAIDVFRKVVDLDPQNPLPHLRLAEAFVRVKDVDGSIERFGAAAEILLRLGRQDDALKVVERLLQHRSEAKFARMAAEILVERGGPGDAMTALTKLQVCFKENPKDLDTLAVLARAFERLGQPTKAVAVQKEAARIAKETGQLDKFEALVDALLHRAPDDDGVRQLHAQRMAALRSSSRPAGMPSSIPAVSSVEIDVDDAGGEMVEDDDLVEASVAPPAAPSAPFELQGGQGNLPDPAVHTRQLLQQAEQLRRGYAYDHAAGLLAGGLAEMPGNRELFDKLCDILIESGDQGAAVEHMLTFAHHLATTGDVDGAARLLDEVLLLEADQPDALQMLANLGYAVPGGYDEAGQQQAYDYDQQAAYAAQQPQQGYADPNAAYDPQAYAAYAAQQQQGYAEQAPQPYQALPSYDLEEVSAVEAMSLSGARLLPDGLAGGQLDDPFAAEGYAQDPYGQPVHEPPLPAFPIDEAAQAQAAYAAALAHAQAHGAYAAQPHAGFLEDRPSQVGFAETSSNQLDEDALEEVEFFASHGMFDEARGLLESELARLPRHPLLLERMRELDAMAADAAGAEDPYRAAEHAHEQGDDRSFDIAASLDMLDAIDAGPVAHGSGGGEADPHQVSVESVFEQFKAGVAAQVAESDAATHYDLGVAYQEMGLLHDAINEFHLAAREPERECVCQSMVGMIHLSLGDVDAAIDSFIRGLHASHRTIDQELALTYEIGNAYEAQGVADQAVYYFQRAAHIDPGYDDPRGSAVDRIQRIEPMHAEGRGATPQGPSFDGDDFAGLLDDKLP